MKWKRVEVVDYPIKVNLTYKKLGEALGKDRAQVYRELNGKIVLTEKAASKLVKQIEKLHNKSLGEKIIVEFPKASEYGAVPTR